MEMSILLVEDHPIFLSGIEHHLSKLSPASELVIADSLESAKDVIGSHSDFSIAIVDLGLPDGDGFDLISTLINTLPNVPVVVMSASDQRTDIRRAFREGVRGYITKDTQPDLMLNALRLVLAGGVYLPPHLISELHSNEPVAAEDKSRNLVENIDKLSGRQYEILKFLVEKKSNKQIAREIGRTEATVKAHVTAVLKTLGVANRSQAAVAAREWGWSS